LRVSEKLLNSEGRELRRALFSLKQIFQVSGFVRPGGGVTNPGRIISQSGQFVFKHTHTRSAATAFHCESRERSHTMRHGDIPLPIAAVKCWVIHQKHTCPLAQINKHKQRKLINGHCAEAANLKVTSRSSRKSSDKGALCVLACSGESHDCAARVCGFFSCKLQVTHINHEDG
jgi:hypothetical protein